MKLQCIEYHQEHFLQKNLEFNTIFSCTYLRISEVEVGH